MVKGYRRGPDKIPSIRTRKREKIKRNCMMCSKEFLSEGNHNRICDACKLTEEWEMGNDYSITRQ